MVEHSRELGLVDFDVGGAEFRDRFGLGEADGADLGMGKDDGGDEVVGKV